MNKSLARLVLVLTLCIALMISLAATFNFFNVWVALGATAISLIILLNVLPAIIDWMAKPVKEEPIPKKKRKPTK